MKRQPSNLIARITDFTDVLLNYQASLSNKASVVQMDVWALVYEQNNPVPLYWITDEGDGYELLGTTFTFDRIHVYINTPHSSGGHSIVSSKIDMVIDNWTLEARTRGSKPIPLSDFIRDFGIQQDEKYQELVRTVPVVRSRQMESNT